jgi:hypothetical protein
MYILLVIYGQRAKLDLPAEGQVITQGLYCAAMSDRHWF